MSIYDWLICGAGITGAALGYELQRSGFKVAIIDRSPAPRNATHFSYGGIPYWSGTTAITKQLCQESIERYPNLSEELDYQIGFRKINLILTLSPEEDHRLVAQNYPGCSLEWLDRQLAVELEPLLNPGAIGGAFLIDHAQVDPRSLLQGYLQAFTRSGGVLIYEEIEELLAQGVKTKKRSIGCGGVVLCVGGMGRRLLNRSGLSLPFFFTHAELIEILPTSPRLRNFIMPADLKRLNFEAKGALQEQAWQEDHPEILPPSLDVGGAPFPDGRMCLGQISRLHPNPDFVPCPTTEMQIRSGIKQLLPQLGDLPGTWHHCLVAFNPSPLPSIGQINDYWWIFSGFTSPMVFVPPLAHRFAQYLRSRQDEIIESLPKVPLS